MPSKFFRLGAAALLLAVAPVMAQAETVELKVSTYLPPNHTVNKELEVWGQEIEKRSGGRLTLRIYPAAQLGPVQRQFDLARNGQADLAVGLTGATPGRYPLTEIAGLPFVNPEAGVSSAITSKRMTALIPKYLAPEYPGLQVLWIGVTPSNTFVTAHREIATLADIKGLKIRFQGEQHAKLLRVLGAAPLQVPPGEIADGMAKGVIDGAVFNYEAADSFGLVSVAKHVMEPPFTAATLALVMNKGKYDALAPDLRAIIDETTGPAEAARLGAMWDLAQQHGRDAMQAGHVAIDRLAPAELEKLKALLAPIVRDDVEALDKTGKPGSKLLADYQQ